MAEQWASSFAVWPRMEVNIHLGDTNSYGNSGMVNSFSQSRGQKGAVGMRLPHPAWEMKKCVKRSEKCASVKRSVSGKDTKASGFSISHL